MFDFLAYAALHVHVQLLHVVPKSFQTISASTRRS